MSEPEIIVRESEDYVITSGYCVSKSATFKVLLWSSPELANSTCVDTAGFEEQLLV